MRHIFCRFLYILSFLSLPGKSLRVRVVVIHRAASLGRDDKLVAVVLREHVADNFLASETVSVQTMRMYRFERPLDCAVATRDNRLGRCEVYRIHRVLATVSVVSLEDGERSDRRSSSIPDLQWHTHEGEFLTCHR